MADYFADPTQPKARKPHRCSACCGPIPVGEVYRQQSGFYEGAAFRNKFHDECWDELTNEPGNFEFCPGDLPVPERLQSTGAKP